MNKLGSDLADTAAMAHVRLIAMWHAGDRDTTLSEADRILVMPSHMPAHREAIRNSLRRWNIERMLPARTEHLNDFWSDPDAAVENPMHGFRSDGPFPLIDMIWPQLARIRCLDPQDRSFLDRMHWGSEFHRRMAHVNGVVGQIHAQQRHDKSPVEEKYLKIYLALHRRIIAPDPAPIREIIASGRSVVLTQAHAGLSTVSGIDMSTFDVPYSMISQGGAPSKRSADFHLATGGPDSGMEFAKLAKLARKSPRLIRLFPDGPFGEMATIRVCDFRVKIGRGAAALAYIGAAATFFSRSVWTGTGFVNTLVPGPSASDYGSKTEFEDDFNAFYASCLEEIVLGAPEDMAPNGGFWSFMTK